MVKIDCNKKVRQESKKSGKISGKNPGETEGTTWKTSRLNFYIIYKGKEPKGQVSMRRLTTKKTSRKDHEKYIIETGKTSRIDRYKIIIAF